MGVKTKKLCIGSQRVKEVFLVLHAAPKCDSETLTTIIKSCLLSPNLPLSNCCRQAYDGAANTRRSINSVQACIKEFNKTVVYVYCMDHQLNLVVQECITDSVEGENALEIFSKVSNLLLLQKRWRTFGRFNLACQKLKIILI